MESIFVKHRLHGQRRYAIFVAVRGKSTLLTNESFTLLSYPVSSTLCIHFALL